MTASPDVLSLRRCARLAGLLYLIIIVAAGFAEGYVRESLIVPGDAATTAGRILGAATLFRIGVFADLMAFMADTAVAVLLFLLLRSAGYAVALVAAAFRLVAHPAIAAVNLVNQYGALLVLERGDAMKGFDVTQREALALHALDLHGYGYLLAGAFFGVHCALLGYLLFRSDLFPRVLGVLLVLASAGYLFESTAAFVAPALSEVAGTFVVVTAGTGEVALCLYLLIRGVRPVTAASG